MKFRIVDIRNGFIRKMILILFLTSLSPIFFIFALILGFISVIDEMKQVVKDCWNGIPITRMKR